MDILSLLNKNVYDESKDQIFLTCFDDELIPIIIFARF